MIWACWMEGRGRVWASLWPSGIDSRLGRNRLWVPGSVGYISHVHWAYDYLGPFGILWVHMAWHKNCVKKKKKEMHTFSGIQVGGQLLPEVRDIGHILRPRSHNFFSAKNHQSNGQNEIYHPNVVWKYVLVLFYLNFLYFLYFGILYSTFNHFCNHVCVWHVQIKREIVLLLLLQIWLSNRSPRAQ